MLFEKKKVKGGHCRIDINNPCKTNDSMKKKD